MASKNGSSWLDQVRILLWRNSILQLRYWPSTLSQTVLAPVVFTLLIFLLQQADYANQSRSNAHPATSDLPGVLPCQGRNPEDPCITMMYYPSTVENGINYTKILEKFAVLNANRIGRTFKFASAISSKTTVPTASVDIVSIPNADFIYDYTILNPNVTQWGVTFSQSTLPNGGQNIRYQVWYNASQTVNITSLTGDVFGRTVLSLTRGLDEAIISYLNDPVSASVNASIGVKMKDWPLIPAATLSDTIVQQLGPTFFFCSQMIIFINILSSIVTEKELKLRHGMELMGLKPFVYWFTQFLSNSLLVAVNALVTCIFGFIFGFQAFRNCNFGVLFFTFFLFGEALIAVAFFITTLVRETRQAIIIGIFFFIIGLLFESVVFSSSLVGYLWWSENTIGAAGWLILMFIPFFNFGHMFLDITSYTTGRLDTLTNTFIPGPGFSWSTLYTPLPNNLLVSYDGIYPNVPAPVQAWYFLIMNVGFWWLVTWYLDNVLPDAFGSRRPFYFFLTLDYWGIRRHQGSTKQDEWLKKNHNPVEAPLTSEDDDVAAERANALSDDLWPAVKVVNLRKVYPAPLVSCGPKAQTTVAVKNSCVTFPQGELLALLGQNGAGKTTTISMLSGLTPATAGDALIYGYSVKDQIQEIRSIMGICPQHDILFDDLTAKEHIELYAGLKGVSLAERQALISDRLAAVKLSTVANVRAGTYSGGMKRRLSLVISTIGDPKIIFLDEPTTGMDPVNRRHVWSFIEKFKQDRVVVLTTHSMEEADVLGDRIAIMSKGVFKAIGNSIHLKTKFGTGYRISIVVDKENIDIVKKTVEEMVPGAKLDDESAGALIYQFPESSTSQVPVFVQWLEKNKKMMVKNWGISQSTLEEVFLKLIRET